mmetsp:Transcript_26729/g.37678  ORF Transcript_26729/g.37678 Transcript_26729/m.37678 type:complete len:431 (-) Transcript_26729:175-1467(-)
MVTWGANTTQTFNTAAPASGTPAPAFGAPAPAGGGFSFGSPAPAPGAPAPAAGGGLFGSTTSAPAPAGGGGLFGSTSPAPAGGGLFGSTTPAPAPAGGGLFGSTSAFGSPAPAPAGGGIFGSTPAPAAGGGLFGSTTATPGFGMNQQQQQQQQQQIPAHAAMQAHMDASARQEEARLMGEMEKLHAAYAGVPPKDDSKDKTSFVCILYNDITPEQLTLQQSIGGNASVVPPPKPPSVSHKEWIDAVANNPDPNLYMPIAVAGADNLRARVGWQQERANGLAKGVAQLRAAHETIAKNSQRYRSDIEVLTRTHAALRKRLLDMMRKVEVVRCMNLPLQQDEVVARQRLTALLRQVEQVASVLSGIQDKARSQPRLTAAGQTDLPDQKQLLQVLTEQRDGIASLVGTLQRDMRDVRLLQQNIVPKLSAPPLG